MQEAKSSDGLQADLLASLSQVKLKKPGKTRRSNQIVSRNKEAIEPLLQTLKNRPKFTKMVEYAVVCLKNMAVDAVSAEELVEEGVIETIMNVMKMNPHNEAILALAYETLNAMCRSEELTREVAQRLEANVVITSLNKCSTSETMASCAALASKILNLPDQAQKYATQHKETVLPALSRATQAFRQEPHILTSLADCVTHIASTSSAAVQAVIETQITNNLVEALRQFPEQQQFVQSSLGFLSCVSSSSAAHAAAIKEMGVVDAVVTALEANPVQDKILAEGAKTLKTLSSKADIALALRVSPTELKSEMATALAKVSSMILVGENIPTFVEANGIPWLLQAIKTATQDNSNAELALRVLRSAPRALMRAAVDEKKIYAIMTAHGVPLLTGVAATHGKDEQVLVAVYNCLSKMITRKENAEYLYKHKLLEILDRGLEFHKYSTALCVPGAAMIERFAQHPSLHESLIESGAAQKLVKSLEVQAAASLVAANAAELTGSVSVTESMSPTRSSSASISSSPSSPSHGRNSSQSLAGTMTHAEIAATLSTAETALTATARILESCASLATSSQGAAALVQSKAIEAIDSVLRNHTKSEVICLAAIRTLDTLQASAVGVTVEVSSGSALSSSSTTTTSGVMVNPEMSQSAHASESRGVFVEAMKKVRLEEAIVKALDLHAESAELQTVGQKFLKGAVEVDTIGNAVTRVVELSMEMIEKPPIAETFVIDLDQAVRVILNLVKQAENVPKLLEKKAPQALICAVEAAQALPVIVQSSNSGVTPPSSNTPEPLTPEIGNTAESTPAKGRNRMVIQRRAGILQSPPSLAALDLDALSTNSSTTTSITSLIPDAQAAMKETRIRQRESLYESLSEAILHSSKHDKKLLVQFGSSEVLGNLVQVVLKNTNLQSVAESIMELAYECVQCVEIVPSLIQAGVINDLVSVAKRFPHNEIVQSVASRSLVELCSEPAIAAKVVQSGGASVVVAALETNFHDSEESTQVLETVHKITLVPEASAAMLNAGGLDAVLAVLRKHEGETEVVKSCMRALVSLLVDETTANEMAEKGVVEMATKAIRTHYKNTILIEAAVVLLGSLATSRKCLEKLASPQIAAVELATWAGSKFKSNTLVVEASETVKAEIGRFKEAEKRRKEVEAARSQAMAEAAKIAKENHRYDMLSVNLQDPDAISDLIQGMQSANKGQLKILFEKVNEITRESGHLTPETAELAVKSGLVGYIAKLISKSTEEEDNEMIICATSPFLKFSEEANPELLAELSQDETFLDAHLDVALVGAKNRSGGNSSGAYSSIEIARSLGTLAKMPVSDELIRALNERNGLPAVYDLMVKSSEPAIMTQAAKLLGKVSNDDASAAALAQLASIRDLIDALRNNISNVEFVRYGVYLLGNLAITEELKDQIGIESGIQLIIQAINMHQKQVELVKNALYSLAALTYDHETNCTFVTAYKGIQLIISLAATYETHADLLESAYCICCNLAYVSDNNKFQIVQNAGFNVCVEGILSHYDNPDLQATALRAIGSLVYDNYTANLAIQAGCIQAIVSLASNADPTLLLQAVPVFDVIVSMTQLDEHFQLFADEGVIPAFLSMSEDNPVELDLQLSISRVLCNLAVNPTLAELIVKQGGVAVILGTVKALGYVQQFADSSMRVLYNLTFSFTNLEHLISVGAAREIVSALQNNTKGVGAAAAAAQAVGSSLDEASSTNELAYGISSENTVLMTGLRCLANLCYTEESTNRVISDGGLDFVVSLLMQNTLSDSALVADVALCLSALCRPETAAVSLVGSTATLIGTWCSQRAPLVEDVTCAAAVMRYLGNLFVHPSVALVVIKQHVPSLIKPLVELLVRSDTVSPIGEIIIACAKPLENLAYSGQDARDVLKSSEVGAVAALESGFTRWNSLRPEVGQACEQALNAIRHVPFKLSNIDLQELLGDRPPIRTVLVSKPSTSSADESKSPDYEIPPAIRNFLTAGALLLKHNRKALPHPRHVYVTDDLRWIIWKDPKVKAAEEETRMKIFQIRSVERGRCTEQLQRQRFGKFLADEKCCFSIQGRERTLDLEANSEKECVKWVEAIEALILYRKALQEANNRQPTFM